MRLALEAIITTV